MDIIIDRGKVIMRKFFREDEIVTAQCLGFTISDDLKTVVADVDYTAKIALLEFLKITDNMLLESHSQVARRNKVFSELKAAYDYSYNKFMNDFKPEQLYSHINKKLYTHQLETLWQYQKKNINLCSFEQGLGKTVFAASISKLFKIPRTIVVCPSLVKWNWIKDLGEDWGYNTMFFTVLDSKKCMYALMHERFVIVNYEMIGKFFKEITFKDCGHIIIDECFSYTTPVLTDKGWLMIGDIVENKIKCKALSCDLSTNELSYKEIVTFYEKERKDRFVKIKHSEGEIICTERHRIYTENDEYKRAYLLRAGDNLRLLQEEVLEDKKEGNAKMLLSSMFKKTSFGISRRLSKMDEKFIYSKRKNKKRFKNNNKVQRMRNRVSEVEIFKKRTMFKKLRSEVEIKTASYKREDFYKREKYEFVKVFEKSPYRKPRISNSIISTNVSRQSNVERRGQRKDDFKSKGQKVQGAWWKRKANLSAGQVNGSNRYGSRICRENVSCERNDKRYAKSLQNRFSLCQREDSCGDRWEKPQIEIGNREGFEKRKSFKNVRVESVEILELGDRHEFRNMRGEDKVYNIEVEGNNNYFANNVLVSNCHKIKNTSSLVHKNVAKLVKHYPNARVTLLTGTPVTNRIVDLFAYLKIAKHPLGDNFTKFKDRYTIGKQRVTGIKNENELYARISNFMVRKKTEECIDLPELRKTKYYFDMDDEHVKEYQAEMEILYNAQQELIEVEAAIERMENDPYHDKLELKDLRKLKRELGFKSRGNINTLNRICANSKIPNIIKLIDELNEQDEKVIVFAGYTETLESLKKHYGDSAVLINGKVSAFKRQEYIDQFKKNPKVKVFIAQFIAGGIGINLVNSSKVIFCNLPFTPDWVEQPMKRAHRGGQVKDVDIMFTMVPDSIDERIYAMLQDKGDDINEVVDRNKENKMEFGSVQQRLFNDLLSSYRKSKGIIDKPQKESGFIKV